ncbi:hypothetical protein HNP84_000504 [Thermocatellispora tengchongensis]|uniref:Uncharacterized protein n=2 Tax=Thermocatellispora tengchongensis TaxID=1073253 RepID=A0A840NX84_9ACTN|nr:hypothetical protein [Thermocatellispora tengchongensis]MBB5130816.1 hypothetical protein [Thermocatellispora tengchongensis]
MAGTFVTTYPSSAVAASYEPPVSTVGGNADITPFYRWDPAADPAFKQGPLGELLDFWGPRSKDGRNRENIVKSRTISQIVADPAFQEAVESGTPGQSGQSGQVTSDHSVSGRKANAGPTTTQSEVEAAKTVAPLLDRLLATRAAGGQTGGFADRVMSMLEETTKVVQDVIPGGDPADDDSGTDDRTAERRATAEGTGSAQRLASAQNAASARTLGSVARDLPMDLLTVLLGPETARFIEALTMLRPDTLAMMLTAATQQSRWYPDTEVYLIRYRSRVAEPIATDPLGITESRRFQIRYVPATAQVLVPQAPYPTTTRPLVVYTRGNAAECAGAMTASTPMWSYGARMADTLQVSALLNKGFAVVIPDEPVTVTASEPGRPAAPRTVEHATSGLNALDAVRAARQLSRTLSASAAPAAEAPTSPVAAVTSAASAALTTASRSLLNLDLGLDLGLGLGTQRPQADAQPRDPFIPFDGPWGLWGYYYYRSLSPWWPVMLQRAYAPELGRHFVVIGAARTGCPAQVGRTPQFMDMSTGDARLATGAGAASPSVQDSGLRHVDETVNAILNRYEQPQGTSMYLQDGYKAGDLEKLRELSPQAIGSKLCGAEVDVRQEEPQRETGGTMHEFHQAMQVADWFASRFGDRTRANDCGRR